MMWNLRMLAAHRGIWRPTELRQVLVAQGFKVSGKKALRLWAGQPVSVRLDDVAMLCQALTCEPNDLLVRDDHEPPVVVQLPTEPRTEPRTGSRATRARELVGVGPNGSPDRPAS